VPSDNGLAPVVNVHRSGPQAPPDMRGFSPPPTIGGGKRSAQLLTRARILLKADTSEAGDGWTDRQIAEALDTSLNTVFNVRQQLVEEGFEATLARKYNPNSARPRIFDGAAEAKLIALACSQAPEGFARWSLRLLEE